MYFGAVRSADRAPFLRNAAVSAHSRLPMHTAVVASIGTTLPEQPCPAISCAKHAKAAAVTATPSTPEKQKRKKLRRETSRLRHNKTASLHIVYAGRRFMYARCKRLLLVGRSLVHVQLFDRRDRRLVKRIFTRSAPVSRTKVSSLMATTRPMTPPMVVTDRRSPDCCA